MNAPCHSFRQAANKHVAGPLSRAVVPLNNQNQTTARLALDNGPATGLILLAGGNGSIVAYFRGVFNGLFYLSPFREVLNLSIRQKVYWILNR